MLGGSPGHEHPALRRKDGEFALVERRHSPAVAVLEDMTMLSLKYYGPKAAKKKTKSK